MSTRVLPDFERRVHDALAVEQPTLRPLEDLITDGCAAALHLETELARLDRQRETSMDRLAHDPAAGRKALDLAERGREVEDDLERVRELLRELMHLRARTRLREFLAQP
jgi:hypothetical protein